jgi:lysophospholipase L1-like esterase
MNYSGRCVALFLILCGWLSAQEVPKTEHSLYWHQRASLFRRLPNELGEIIFLGDSITDGNNWSEMLGNPLIKNRGISGDTTQGILDRLDEVVESRPAKIFLMIGINDLAQGLSEKEVLANIKRIVQQIRRQSPDTAIYLESMLPVNPDFGLFPAHTSKRDEILNINKVLERIAEDYGLRFVDLHSLFAGKDNKLRPEFTNDGLHLTGAGYAVWKKAVTPHLR